MNLRFGFRQRILRRAGIVALILGGILLLIIASTLIFGAPDVSELAAAVGMPTLSAESYCAQWFALGANIPPETRAGMQAAYDKCVQARKSTAPISARLTPVPRGPKNTPPLTAPPYIAPANVPHRALGNGTVLEEGSSMFPDHYLIENQWWQTLGDQWIRVYAGAQRGDGVNELPKPWQGIVAVSVVGLDGTMLPAGGMYKTPKQVGSVKIVDAQGQRLALKAEDGTLFYFDIPTRQFVSGLAATVTPVKPTVPPYP